MGLDTGHYLTNMHLSAASFRKRNKEKHDKKYGCTPLAAGGRPVAATSEAQRRAALFCFEDGSDDGDAVHVASLPPPPAVGGKRRRVADEAGAGDDDSGGDGDGEPSAKAAKATKIPPPPKPPVAARQIEEMGGQLSAVEPPRVHATNKPLFDVVLQDFICDLRIPHATQDACSILFSILPKFLEGFGMAHSLFAIKLDNGELDPAKLGAHAKRYGGGGVGASADPPPRARTEAQVTSREDTDTATRWLVARFLSTYREDGMFARWPHSSADCVTGTRIRHDPMRPPGNILSNREVVYEGFVLATMRAVRTVAMPRVTRYTAARAGAGAGAAPSPVGGQFILASGPRPETIGPHSQPGETIGVTLDEMDASTGECAPARSTVPHIVYPHALNLVSEEELYCMPGDDAAGATTVMAVIATARFLAKTRSPAGTYLDLAEFVRCVGDAGGVQGTSRGALFWSRARDHLISLGSPSMMPLDTVEDALLDSRRKTWFFTMPRCVRRVYALRHDFPRGAVPFTLEAIQADTDVRTIEAAIRGDGDNFDASGISEEDLASFAAAKAAQPDPLPCRVSLGDGLDHDARPILNHHAGTRLTMCTLSIDSDMPWEQMVRGCGTLWGARSTVAPRDGGGVGTGAGAGAGAFQEEIDPHPFGADGESTIPPAGAGAGTPWGRLCVYTGTSMVSDGPRGGAPTRRRVYHNADLFLFEMAQRVRNLVSQANARRVEGGGGAAAADPGGGVDFRRAPDEVLALLGATRIFLGGNDYVAKLANTSAYSYLMDLQRWDPTVGGRHPLCDFADLGRVLDPARGMGLSARKPVHIRLDVTGMTDAIVRCMQRDKATLALKKNPRGLVASRVASLEYYLSLIFSASAKGLPDPFMSVRGRRAGELVSVTGFGCTEDADGDGQGRREMRAGLGVTEDDGARARAYATATDGHATRHEAPFGETAWEASRRRNTIKEALARQSAQEEENARTDEEQW
jgi:hypothetical protein